MNVSGKYIALWVVVALAGQLSSVSAYAQDAAAPGAVIPASNGAARSQATASAGTATPGYRVNAGDELNIYVWGEDRLQRDVRVLPDGSFAFPLVGQVSALGKLPIDIEAILSERLREQYRGQVPKITVSVKAADGLQFSVMGRVKSPGAFAPGRYVNILEALSLAGGPTEFASLDNVVILRKRGTQLVPLRARLAPLFRTGVSSGDLDRSAVIAIEPGDTVIVP
ncbi:polysaccharide biosynthesis/export family protein [Sphingomonas sp. M1-B02]|uniref:polysaccharide biosynthesis/export family protein n=1 Tax=Sphingomonas sp. M1-B02 TaxID=3114300 RepID=UPI0022402421|nr:polysaccharide biosynthesis/export family protein [Sphingomonas sp. S6-11]UZK67732.1 polysaccharide biosynthesis/export family protein [Sphingomonas sp. S6-11]